MIFFNTNKNSCHGDTALNYWNLLELFTILGLSHFKRMCLGLGTALIRTKERKYRLYWGARYLTGKNLKVVWVKFLTLS